MKKDVFSLSAQRLIQAIDIYCQNKDRSLFMEQGNDVILTKLYENNSTREYVNDIYNAYKNGAKQQVNSIFFLVKK